MSKKPTTRERAKEIRKKLSDLHNGHPHEVRAHLVFLGLRQILHEMEIEEEALDRMVARRKAEINERRKNLIEEYDRTIRNAAHVPGQRLAINSPESPTQESAIDSALKSFSDALKSFQEEKKETAAKAMTKDKAEAIVRAAFPHATCATHHKLTYHEYRIVEFTACIGTGTSEKEAWINAAKDVLSW